MSINFMSTSRPLFTVQDAAELLGIPRRKVALMVEQKIIEPAVSEPGRGRPRKFRAVDLLKIDIASQLTEFGIAPRYLQLLGKYLDKLEVTDFDSPRFDLEKLAEDHMQGKISKEQLLETTAQGTYHRVSLDDAMESSVDERYGLPELILVYRHEGKIVVQLNLDQTLPEIPGGRYQICVVLQFRTIVESLNQKIENYMKKDS